jgi:N-carbamoylputrescine amidase
LQFKSSQRERIKSRLLWNNEMSRQAEGKVVLAATQMACSLNLLENVDRAEALVREAAGRGADIVLLQELFEGRYFPQEQNPAHLALAQPREGHPTLARMSKLAAELGVVLPISFFEKCGQVSLWKGHASLL